MTMFSTDIPGIRENSFVIRDAMINGLSPDDRMPRNAPYAETMQGLQATPFCAASPAVIEQPSNITDGIPVTQWASTGTPILVMGEKSRWTLGQVLAYKCDSSWTQTVQGATFTAGGPWQYAFFQDYGFFTNGSVFFWGTDAQRTTALTVNAVGKDQDRLLLGGLSGSVLNGDLFQRVLQLWKSTQDTSLAYASQAFSTGWIIYGKQRGGSSDRPFDDLLALLSLYTTDNQSDLESLFLTGIDKERSWGMAPMRYTGAVQAFHELTTGPLVFGDNGVSRLNQSGELYSDQRILGVGIGGRGCVGGWLGGCVMLDNQYNLWRFGPDSPPTRLRFFNHLSSLTLSEVTIAYDPEEEVYWIADKSRCYTLDSRDKLSGPFYTYAHGLVRDAGKLYGIVHDTREVVTNGDFTSSTGWSLNAGWAISGGTANATTTTGSAVQTPTGLTANTKYLVRYKLTVTSGTARVVVGGTNGTTRSASGTYSETITSAAGTTIGVQGVTSFTGVVDNLSITPYYTDIVFRSTALDNNERGTKTLIGLQIGQEGMLYIRGGMDYRYRDSDSSYSTGTYSPATDASAVFTYPRVEYADGKVVLTAKATPAVRAKLERIEVHYQGDDITYNRGTKGGSVGQ